jgi:N-acyl homoserine lactone hydrolase
MKLLTGDFDVFGDSSATLLSTPGHTPGHQSLLVQLGNTGWVVLTGDAAHFKDNWDNDRVPSINSSPEQTHASHALLAKIIAEKKAALWINHDLPTFDSLKGFAGVWPSTSAITLRQNRVHGLSGLGQCALE